MARGMVPIKGGSTRVNTPNMPQHPSFALGTRPAVLRGEPLSRPAIKPQGASKRDYGKPAFSTLGSGNTAATGES